MSEANGKPLLAYVPDGYTLKAVINAIPGLSPRISFTWRPMTAREVHVLQSQQNELDGSKNSDKWTLITAQSMKNHILDWDIVDEKGVTQDCNDDSFYFSLLPPTFLRIYSIVIGSDPGDLSANAPREEVDEWQRKVSQDLEGMDLSDKIAEPIKN